MVTANQKNELNTLSTTLLNFLNVFCLFKKKRERERKGRSCLVKHSVQERPKLRISFIMLILTLCYNVFSQSFNFLSNSFRLYKSMAYAVTLGVLCVCFFFFPNSRYVMY